MEAEPRFVVHYWPISFRGTFLTYLLAYEDVSFDETGREDVLKMMELQFSEKPVPFTGPPILFDRKENFYVSQMPAAYMYLVDVLGLKGKSCISDALTLKIVMDCNDVLMEICRYNGSSMWTRKEWNAFRHHRLVKWLCLFEEGVRRGHIGASDTAAADVSSYALWGNMARCLPELREDIVKNAPTLATVLEKVGRKNSLASYISDVEVKLGKLYCSGQIEESIRDMLKTPR